MSIKLGINGFGRIGRMVLRASLKCPEIEVVAINDLSDPATMAHLLTYDSVHGKLAETVKTGNNEIQVGKHSIAVTAVKDPEKLQWRDMGVDIVAECTGIFRDRDGASKHLLAGAKKVIISAPAKEPDITMVMGVNANRYEPNHHHIISNASCTTNCLAPVAKVILENFGIKRGLMTTIHSYTGDQRLVDFPHKDLRRARAAALSMIPTTTGAAAAVSLVLPELKGKLNGLAIRVPTPNVSLVDLVATIEKDGMTVSDINDVLKNASKEELSGIMEFCEAPLVSTDFNGSTVSSIVDSGGTMVVENMIKVIAWYDNEAGYAARMVDLAVMIGMQL
jgi:glyceraldehyde 3-phosphate dehydrogenase